MSANTPIVPHGVPQTVPHEGLCGTAKRARKQALAETVPHSAAYSYRAVQVSDTLSCTTATPRGASENMRHGAALRHCAALDMLAARVAGLHLSWTDPEAFHLEKFTVAAELRRLARELGRAA